MPTTHGLKLFTPLPLKTVCERNAQDCPKDYVAGPQEVEKIDCVGCLRVLAKHGHALTLLAQEKGVEGIVQVCHDEIESQGREAKNTSEPPEYRALCSSGVRAWSMLRDLLGEVSL